ncbi:MAG: DUF948 domain-containing protein [Deltaproteobacteria bacterium]|nr:DUF948 domain-containing protein [Deltaproteobacteria bacterium]
MSWGVGLFVLGMALLLFVLFAVPALIQVRRTAKKVETTLGHVNQNLPAILDNVRHTSENFRKTTEAIRRVPEDVQSVTDEFRRLKEQVPRLENRVRDGFEVPSFAGFGIMKKSAVIAFVIIRVLRFLRSRGR